MTTAQLAHYRERLWEMAQRTHRDASSVGEQVFAPTGDQATGGLSNAPLHLGDVGTEEYLHELNATLLENQEYLVKEALEAMRRIDEGTYGRCENCQQPIVKARLDAIPFARYCAACAEVLKPGPQVNLNAGRPAQADQVAGLSEGTGERHASGSAGGGTSVGGLAGSNAGRGQPDAAALESATATGASEADESDDEESAAVSGKSGGAVGGTPAGKRSKARRSRPGRRH